MPLRALALRLLALCTLRPTCLASRKALRVEAALARLLHTAAALRALTDADTRLANTDTNTRTDVLDAADVPAVRLVRSLGRPTGCALPERRARRRAGRLSKPHEALDALRTGAVERLVLAVLGRRQAASDVHVLPDRVLCVVLVPEIVIRVGLVLLLLAIQPLSVG